MKDGSAGRKWGLIAEWALIEHLPFLSSSQKVHNSSAGSPSCNNEFSWSADTLLNIHYTWVGLSRDTVSGQVAIAQTLNINAHVEYINTNTH